MPSCSDKHRLARVIGRIVRFWLVGSFADCSVCSLVHLQLDRFQKLFQSKQPFIYVFYEETVVIAKLVMGRF